MADRFPAPVLINFGSALLRALGLEQEKAQTVAEILVEGDLLGHSTHGLSLLPLYLQDLEDGKMSKEGEPQTLSDFPAVLTWDGKRLPGPWLTVQAVERAVARAHLHGTGTVVIRRSHHIACLAAYLKRVTDRGLMILLTCTDPAAAGVAPHGGKRDVYTPNPLAAAWPTEGDPVILDVCQSITTYGLTRRLTAEGRKLPGQWLIDHEGNPTDDPSVMFSEPRGAFLPVGGLDHGHKGYALGLLMEALTGGLAGHGRADPAEGWTATVFLQVLDPAKFGGTSAFTRQTSWLSAACHATPPRPGFERVRLPGEVGLRRREDQLAHGVELYPTILPALQPWAKKTGVHL